MKLINRHHLLDALKSMRCTPDLKIITGLRRSGKSKLLAAHGYRILAEAIEQNLPYEIDCPAMLICGERDMAGSAKRYNAEWTKRTGVPLVWIPNAGHNANTDQPELINSLIEKMLLKLAACSLDEHLKEHQREE